MPEGNDAGEQPPTLEEALAMVQAQEAEQAAATDDSETPAAEGEAAAPKAEEAQAAEEDDTKSKEEEAPAKGRSSVLQKLIDSKYGGDEDKFAEGLYEMQNSAAALRQELAELKRELRQPQQQEDEEVQHPDIPWLDKREQALKGKVAANQQEQQVLITKMVEAKAKIDRQQGKLEATEDPDLKDRIQRELSRLEDKQERQQDRYRELGGAVDNTEIELEAIGRQRQFAQQQVDQFKAQRKQQVVDDRQFEVNTLETFATAADEQAKRYGFAKDAPERAYLEGVLKDQLIAHLDSLPEDADAVDIPAFVKQRAEAFAKVAKLGSVKQQATTAKLQVSKPPAPKQPVRLTPEAATAAKMPLKGLTGEQARLRARKILGA